MKRSTRAPLINTVGPILLTLLLAACAHQLPPSSSAGDQAGQVLTEADAIAVVLAKIQRDGGDPAREECSAQKSGKGWNVTAWHIWYPENQGSSRFVPGGFKTYVVSDNGKIIETIPGH